MEFSRTVRVDRTRSPQEALAATGYKQHVDSAVVATMPQGVGEKVEVHFFTIDATFTPDTINNPGVIDEQVDQEFFARNLVPVDPITLAAINEADPAFASTHRNGTHWRDAEGNRCFASFVADPVERSVDVYRNGRRRGYILFSVWWFVGLRKAS